MKWRLVLINAKHPGAAFYTIQVEDYSVLPYNKSLQDSFASISKEYKLTLGGIGDAYSEWQSKELPEFLITVIKEKII